MKRRTFINALVGAAAFGLGAKAANATAQKNAAEIAEWQRFEFAEQKMGVPTRILMYAPDAETANAAACFFLPKKHLKIAKSNNSRTLSAKCPVTYSGRSMRTQKYTVFLESERGARGESENFFFRKKKF